MVSEVEQGSLTYKQAQDRYGIQGKSTVLVWLRKHGNLHGSALQDRPLFKSEPPEQTIKGLEQARQEARDKVYLMDELMTLLDGPYGSHLRKKYVSK